MGNCGVRPERLPLADMPFWEHATAVGEVSVLALSRSDNDLRRTPMLTGIRGTLSDHGPHGHVDIKQACLHVAYQIA